MIKAAIIGATGYSGVVLTNLLCAHKEVEIVSLTSKSYTGKKYSEVFPNFGGICDLILEEQNISEISKKADVIFLALPHGAASSLVTKEILNNTKIIDLGADFRLKDASVYEKWYGVNHFSKELLPEAVYGLSELNFEQIKDAKLLANPGCYATCSILTLAPLVKNGLVVPDDIIIDAKSGVSGAGRALNLGVHYCECSESIKPYKVASHRHTPEIEQALSNGAVVNFTPHLVPMNRGILVSAYLKLKKDISLFDIKEIYKEFYKNKPFIRLLEGDSPPETRFVKGSNYCDINLFYDLRTKKILAFGAIDNLFKGAAGQAVQNMNIMFNLPENTSLTYTPNFP